MKNGANKVDKLIVYLAVLALVLAAMIFVGIQAFSSPAKEDVPVNAPDNNNKEKEEPRAPPNFMKALETGDSSKCDEQGMDEAKCIEFLNFAKKYCTGEKIDEKIFCIAFLKREKSFCEWIKLDWFGTTCNALIDQNLEKCLEIDYWKNKALCISELVRNFPQIKCNLPDKNLQLFCEAQSDFNKEKCSVIENTFLKQQCLELLERETPY